MSVFVRVYCLHDPRSTTQQGRVLAIDDLCIPNHGDLGLTGRASWSAPSLKPTCPTGRCIKLDQLSHSAHWRHTWLSVVQQLQLLHQPAEG